MLRKKGNEKEIKKSYDKQNKNKIDKSNWMQQRYSEINLEQLIRILHLFNDNKIIKKI
jgi:hypothetical protein